MKESKTAPVAAPAETGKKGKAKGNKGMGNDSGHGQAQGYVGFHMLLHPLKRDKDKGVGKGKSRGKLALTFTCSSIPRFSPPPSLLPIIDCPSCVTIIS